MLIKPNRDEAFRLLHEGMVALAKAEINGIRIDVDYCRRQKKVIRKKIERLKDKLEKTELMKIWRKVFGEKTNINSGPQLAHILFDKMGLDPVKLTEKENPSTDKESLEELGLPEVDLLVEIRRLTKVSSTYLDNIIRETVDGFLHPFFNLGTVSTYRSSSSNPNFQNIPIRIPEIGKIVRRAFLPRPGRRLVEVDYSGIEVRVAACYHRDPTMLEYINDPSKDMHRDMAMELYMLPQEEVSKQARYSAKNGFVFPEFYGDYWADCARALWKNITTLKLKTAKTGIPLRKHLASKGIRKYEKFEGHVKRVEEKFWNVRFPEYTEWKDRLVAHYEKHGWVDTLTGFRCAGMLRRNEVINYPIQGSAFHCLLWTLIEVQKEIERRKMETLLVGQIHDSGLFDVPDEELDEFLPIFHDIACNRLRGAWDWIIVPLEVEAEVTPVDGSWHEKKEVPILH